MADTTATARPGPRHPEVQAIEHAYDVAIQEAARVRRLRLDGYLPAPRHHGRRTHLRIVR